MSQPAAEQFDRVASAYATSAVHANGPDLPWLLEALAPQPAWQVLDLGTGAGHAALTVAPHVARVTAVDVSDRMLATAARLAAERHLDQIVFQRADVASLPLESRSVDGAFTRYSAHHWPAPERAIAELARVVRAGAPFVLIDTVSPDDPALDTFVNALELLRDPSHARNWRVGEWRSMLAAHSLRVESVRTWEIELETEGWLARSATDPWRAEACRNLLRTAPSAARAAFGIAEDGSSFRLHTALLLARREQAA